MFTNKGNLKEPIILLKEWKNQENVHLSLDSACPNWDTDAQQTCKFRLGVFAKPLQCYNGTVGQESIVPIWIATSFGILKHNLTWSFIFVFCTVLLYKGASNSCFRTVSFNLIQYVERHYPRRSQLLLGGAIWFPNESLPEDRKQQILEIEAELCTWFLSCQRNVNTQFVSQKCQQYTKSWVMSIYLWLLSSNIARSKLNHDKPATATSQLRWHL